MPSRSILRKASRLASYNISLQVLLRVLTFLVNALTLWLVSNEMKACHSSLTLLYSTLVFLSREAFRRACLSRASGSGHNWRQVINLLWLVLLPLGMAWALLLVAVWLYVLDAPVMAVGVVIPHYGPAVQIIAWAAVLELLAEPFWLLSQAHMFVTLKVVAESLAVMAKCALTVALVLSAPGWGLYIFAAAQLAYSAFLVLCYGAYFRHFLASSSSSSDGGAGGRRGADRFFPVRTAWDLLPWRRDPGDPLIDRAMARLTLSFFWQSLLRQALAEAERYLTLTKVLGLDERGVYHAVTNLGSAAARAVFQPVGENFYVFFAKALERGHDARHQKREEVGAAAEALESLLKLMLVSGLVVAVFGWSYATLVLDAYGGPELSGGEGPALLRCYALYVLLLAVNGVTDCFVFAAMSHREVDWYNPVMLGMSAAFLLLAYALAHCMGSLGFVLANCANMALRALYGLVYIRRYFRQSQWRPLRGLRPSPALMVTLAVSVALTAMSEARFCCDAGWLWRTAHLGVGAACLLAVLLTVLCTEHKLVTFVRTQLLPHSDGKKAV